MLVLKNGETYAASGRLADLLRWESLLVFAVLFGVINGIKAAKKLHPAVFLLLSAVAGIVLRLGSA